MASGVPSLSSEDPQLVGHPGKPSKKLAVIILSITLIVGGLFAFIGLPIMGAVNVIRINIIALSALTVTGLATLIIGLCVLAKCSPKTPIPPQNLSDE